MANKYIPSQTISTVNFLSRSSSGRHSGQIVHMIKVVTRRRCTRRISIRLLDNARSLLYIGRPLCRVPSWRRLSSIQSTSKYNTASRGTKQTTLKSTSNICQPDCKRNPIEKEEARKRGSKWRRLRKGWSIKNNNNKWWKSKWAMWIYKLTRLARTNWQCKGQT